MMTQHYENSIKAKIAYHLKITPELLKQIQD